MSTKLSDLPTAELRRMLRATIAEVGETSNSAGIIRREIRRKEAAERRLAEAAHAAKGTVSTLWQHEHLPSLGRAGRVGCRNLPERSIGQAGGRRGRFSLSNAAGDDVVTAFKPEHVTAIIDTREQLPLDLSPLQVVRNTLVTAA